MITSGFNDSGECVEIEYSGDSAPPPPPGPPTITKCRGPSAYTSKHGGKSGATRPSLLLLPMALVLASRVTGGYAGPNIELVVVWRLIVAWLVSLLFPFPFLFPLLLLLQPVASAYEGGGSVYDCDTILSS